MIIEQNKIKRGETLRVLYRNLPHPVGDNVLSQIFTDISLPAIQGHLRYLEAGEYVELEDIRKDYSTATMMAKLTKKGVDLLEGSIDPDPGIALPPL